METIVPVAPERHKKMRWRRPDSYKLAAGLGLAGISVGEAGDAAVAFPMAFVKSGEQYVLTVMLGLRPDQNLFVATDGRWLGRYIPSVIRNRPFVMGSVGNGSRVLCVNESSPLITEGGEGQRFFDDDGKLAPGMQEVVEAVSRYGAEMDATVSACEALAGAGVIEPWPITTRSGQGQLKTEGLYRVNERALVSLPDDAYLSLRPNGALALAYAQIISMRNLPVLAAVANAAANPGAQLMKGGEIDLSWMNS